MTSCLLDCFIQILRQLSDDIANWKEKVWVKSTSAVGKYIPFETESVKVSDTKQNEKYKTIIMMVIMKIITVTSNQIRMI